MTISTNDLRHDAGLESVTAKMTLLGRASGGEDITFAEMDCGRWSYSAVGDRWVRAGTADTLEHALAEVNGHLRERIAPATAKAVRTTRAPHRTAKPQQSVTPAGGLF